MFFVVFVVTPKVFFPPRKPFDSNAGDSDAFCDCLGQRSYAHCDWVGAGDVCGRRSRRFAIAIFGCSPNPDPPILVFFFCDFLVYFFDDFLAFLCGYLSFLRIPMVPQREKPLLFLVFPLLFFSKKKKSKGWRVRVRMAWTPGRLS